MSSRQKFLTNRKKLQLSRAQLASWTLGRVVSVNESTFVFSSAETGNAEEFSMEGAEIMLDFDNSAGWSDQASEVLRPGDWLALKLQNQKAFQLLLLSPNGKADYPVAKARAMEFEEFVFSASKVLSSLGYQRVSTPSLVKCPGLEPHLTPFHTQWNGASLYLPTSPEIHLKKLLCRGYQNIFEIKPVFRNEQASRQHRPEFMMLEFYLSFANLRDLEEDLKNWLSGVSGKAGLRWVENWQRISVSELFKEALDFDLKPETTRNQLLRLGQALGVDVSDDDDFDDLYQKIWVEKIDPVLESKSGGLILHSFPPGQAALAEINSRGWADRFELYLGGVECGNAYQELTDADEQLRRFEQFQTQRGDGVPIDMEFIEHLRSGMPPTAGIAVGLDRVFMAIHGIKDIGEIYEFQI